MEKPSKLHDLARAAGIDPAYKSYKGEPVATSDKAILLALQALAPDLGYELRSADDAATALVALEAATWAERVGPVCIGWDGALVVSFRVPADQDAEWEITVTTDASTTHRASGTLFTLPADSHAHPGGAVHCIRRATVPGVELGYHVIAWRCGEATGESFAVVAPTMAFGGPGKGARRWGVFAPVYGIANATSGETGDLATLRALFDRVGARGGKYVATLPILAGDPASHTYSPYSPVSRLFWNELYLDLAAIAAAAGMPAPVAPPVTGEKIDYAAQYAWRRAAFDPIAARIAGDPTAAATLETWAETHDVYDYAAFRALGEQHGGGWRAWPKAHRDGVAHVKTRAEALALGAEPARVDAHVIAQCFMQRQLEELVDDRPDGVALYLDLPVGVSTDAYEVWRDRDQFLTTLAAGAPPDALFLGGQNWGLPPVSPVAQRRARYRNFIRTVRHHMSVAGMLRVDHVMGLFRLYCVPEGLPATDGVYLRYPHEELLAILALESQRKQCALVGEDLGTVPDHVRPAMAKHGLFRLHVGQWHLPAKPGLAPIPSPPESVASLNTHDTATMTGWWRGADLDDQLALSLITPEVHAKEKAKRELERAALIAHAGERHAELPVEERAMVVATEDLAKGPAEVVLVALDDISLHPVPHNVPGTTSERPNWLRRVDGWETALDHVAVDAVVAARPPTT